MAVLFIVFGGYYVNSATVPRALRWVPNASLIQHGFQVTSQSVLPACLMQGLALCMRLSASESVTGYACAHLDHRCSACAAARGQWNRGSMQQHVSQGVPLELSGHWMGTILQS